MLNKICQIVLVGHHPKKLIFSIDKEVFDKLVFITETQERSGSLKAKETLRYLINEYKGRKVDVENKTFSFDIEMKPVAELTHLIYQQKIILNMMKIP